MAPHSPSTPSEGSVRLVLTPASVRLVITGEFDMSNQATLADAVAAVPQYRRPVEIDTRDVTFIDSASLATIGRLIRRSQHRPTFVQPSPVVRFLLDVTRLDELVDVVDHEQVTPPITDLPTPPSATGDVSVGERDEPGRVHGARTLLTRSNRTDFR